MTEDERDLATSLVRLWAVDLVHRYSTELAIGSLRMGLQISEIYAQYVMTGVIPEEEVFDEADGR